MAGHRTLACVATSLTALSILLAGCGGGAGPSPSPPGPSPGPSPAPGPVACPALMTRGHCSSCYWDGKNTTCKACTGDYTLDPSPASADVYCIYDCSKFKPGDKPAKPDNPMQHNGIEWPGVCINESVSYFFTIGDWGGLCGWGKDNVCKNGTRTAIAVCGESCADPGMPAPMPNRPTGNKDIDGRAQKLVADRMRERQDELVKANTPARYIINVGDNFYPGGLDFHCGGGDRSDMSVQWEQMWKNMYTGELRKLEWWSVLGNHDYGGVCYTKGWDQQIFYTWHDDKWIMPGQYWKRTVQYKNFKVDFFFLDGNSYDTRPGTVANHDICSMSNPGGKTPGGEKCELSNYPGDGGNCGASGPHELSECRNWFAKVWEDNHKWLKQVLPQSTAEWQMIVQHYPASFALGDGASHVAWEDFLEPMGVDLYISGHTHSQLVYYGDCGPSLNMGKTAWVISGGGGGITSQQIPVSNGHDDAYGYMEMEIALDYLQITAYSHGGIQGEKIIRNQTKVTPVPRKSYAELVGAGLMLPEEVPTNELKGDRIFF